MRRELRNATALEIAPTPQAGQAATDTRFSTPLIASEDPAQGIAMNQTALNPDGPPLAGDKLMTQRRAPEFPIELAADLIGNGFRLCCHRPVRCEAILPIQFDTVSADALNLFLAEFCIGIPVML